MIKSKCKIYLQDNFDNISQPEERKMESKDSSTEDRIKNAAKIVFHKKGFAAEIGRAHV